MSAHLGQKRKLDWVKSGLGAAVGRIDQGSSFGLWAFGANPQKKCDAMSELVPLQPASAAAGAVDKALAALQPKAARAPVLSTLEAALKSAASPDGKAVSANPYRRHRRRLHRRYLRHGGAASRSLPERQADGFGHRHERRDGYEVHLRGEGYGRVLHGHKIRGRSGAQPPSDAWRNADAPAAEIGNLNSAPDRRERHDGNE